MKPEELRIGNWVYMFGSTSVCSKVNIKSIEFYDLMEPIPLTEEWLERFGFEFDGEWWDYLNFGINIRQNRCSESLGEFGFNYYPIPKYVHQLQNLYYALTGEELEIKDK